jgi:hypothetical protein
MPSPLPAYAELHALSNFSFQRGSFQAEDLVERLSPDQVQIWQARADHHPQLCRAGSAPKILLNQ